jgi:hypothetical protein
MGLILTHHKYINDLLLQTNMDTSKGVSRPILPTDKLSLRAGDPLSSGDTTKYKSVVGALQYLSFTRLDLFLNESGMPVFSVPTTSHWVTVKQILHYL